MPPPQPANKQEVPMMPPSLRATMSIMSDGTGVKRWGWWWMRIYTELKSENHEKIDREREEPILVMAEQPIYVNWGAESNKYGTFSYLFCVLWVMWILCAISSCVFGRPGLTGFIGFTGSICFSCFTGFIGFTGHKGFTGLIGFTSYIVFTGFRGFTGFIGLTGFIGFTGFLCFTGFGHCRPKLGTLNEEKQKKKNASNLAFPAASKKRAISI